LSQLMEWKAVMRLDATVGATKESTVYTQTDDHNALSLWTIQQ
jgi:hypothetical protein